MAGPIDTSGIANPADSHEYQDFEIPLEARENIKEIERCLAKSLYKNERMIRDHIDLLENLDTEASNALQNEARIGRNNVTLKHDMEHIRSLLKQLELKLNELS